MKLAAFGFEDDMDYVQTARDNECEEEVFKNIQEGMRLWEEFFRVTGGAIEKKNSEAKS